MKLLLQVVATAAVIATPALAQFTGPSVRGQPSTVEAVADMRVGTDVVLTGNIVAHQRSDYFTFRDDTGDIRVEIGPDIWRGRPVSPETKVRLLGEVDRGFAGRYIWVKTLDVVQ